MRLLKVLPVLFALVAMPAFAQEEESETDDAASESLPQNVIGVNPLGLLFGYISANYERALSPKMSLVIDGRLGGFLFGYNYIGVGGGVHLFTDIPNSPFGSLTGNAPSGPWYGPEVAVDFYTWQGFGSWLQVTGGGMVGYNWMFGADKRWVLSFGIGLGLYFNTAGSIVSNYANFGITGLGRGTLGYAF